MKLFKSQRIFLAALAMTVAFASSAQADLTASQYVSNFNSMNSGQGLLFTFSDPNGVYPGESGSEEFWIVNSSSSATFADLGAYASTTSGTRSGLEYFSSFCVAPGRNVTTGTVSGKLSYEASSGRTITSEGKALTIGAAFLYMAFASGDMNSYFSNSFAYTGDASVRANQLLKLKDTVQALIGATTFYDSYWTSNTYLSQMLSYFQGVLGMTADETKDYLRGTYDTNANYSFMGDYVVFVMNATKNGSVTQDVLFLGELSGGGGGNGVPEPATLLLWAVGSIGMAGGSYWKRKRQVK